MSGTNGERMRRKAVPLVLLSLAVLLVAAPSALAAPTVSRAELRSGELRIEGRAQANSAVTVASPTAGESSVTRNADGSGNFRIEASGFRSSTCRVNVSDPTGTTSATLSGCTASSPPPPPPPEEQPPTGCTITPQAPATYNVGDLQTYFWSTTGCQTSNAPVQWNLESGQIPPGMTGPHTQGVGSGFVTGRPTTVGTFTFTVRVRDNVGATDTESFTIRVDPARPVRITTQGFSDGTVGVSPCCWNLFSDGGAPPYTYRVVQGSLPPGTSIQRFDNGTRIAGTPTTAGTFSFSLVSTDSRGSQSAATPFSIVVHPRG
jgi:hypothetical protein